MAGGLTGVTNDAMSVYGKGQQFIAASFAPNTTSDPVVSTIKGDLVNTIVFSSTGTWTIVFKKTVVAVIAGGAEAQITSGATIDTSLQFKVTSLAPLTVVIRNNPGGSVANITAATDDRINFWCVAQTGVIR